MSLKKEENPPGQLDQVPPPWYKKFFLSLPRSFLLRTSIRAFFLSTSVFGFMLWWEHPDYIKLIIESKYAGKYEYLTYLGVAITIGTISASVVADLLHFVNPQKQQLWWRAAGVRNWLLAICFPIETLITIFYWSLRLYDRSLVTSTHLLKRAELVVIESDLANHLLPFIYVWIELLLFSPSIARPLGRKIAHKVALVILNGAYMVWSHFLFLQNKKWVYPLLGRLTTTQHFGLVTVTSSFTLVAYYFGIWLLSRQQ